MSIVLYHHPHSRAASVVWMLEELGVDYELRFVDFAAGEHKTESILALNPMGKLPILTDGDQVVTETAAIGLYLADRYASGRLAPAVDDPKRAAYLRWSLFSPSVIEPCAMAKMSGWEYKDGQAGWGAYDAMLKSIEHALGGRDYLLGEFSMADMIFGGTVRFMLMFNMIDPSPATTAYAARLTERPAFKRAEERNAAIARERGLAG